MFLPSSRPATAAATVTIRADTRRAFKPTLPPGFALDSRIVAGK
jgi:hypothetical protein